MAEYTPLFPEQAESDKDDDDKESERKQERGKNVQPRIPFELISKPEVKLEDEEDDDDDEEDEEKKDDKAAAAESEQESAAETVASEQGEEEDATTDDTAATDVPTAEPSQPEATPEQTAPEEPAFEDIEDEGEILLNRDQPEAPEAAEPEEPSAADSEESPLAFTSERLPDEEPEDTTPPTPPAPAAGGGAQPPPPPVPPTTSTLFNQSPGPFGPNWNVAPVAPAAGPNYNVAPFSPPSASSAEIDAEKQKSLRRGLVAGFITGYVLKAYLAHRKAERIERETEKQLDQRDERIDFLEAEQHRMQERAKAQTTASQNERGKAAENRPQTTPEALPPVKTASDEKLFDEEGNEIILQPGWHVERSTGGYSVVLDEHNRVVYEAIHYGEAYRRDRRPEQVREDLFAAADTNPGPSAAGQPAPGYEFLPLPNAPGTVAQPDAQHLPEANKLHEIDVQHRLPSPRNQVLATVLSPWLWTAIAILLIVYFAAALA